MKSLSDWLHPVLSVDLCAETVTELWLLSQKIKHLRSNGEGHIGFHCGVSRGSGRKFWYPGQLFLSIARTKVRLSVQEMPFARCPRQRFF